jgi:hypothetical protein
MYPINIGNPDEITIKDFGGCIKLTAQIKSGLFSFTNQ